jgi:SulP family sulfate permease
VNLSTWVLRDLPAGAVAALVTLSYSISYAALIWSGSTLEPFLSSGLHAALIAATVQALVVALTSSLPFAIAGPDSNATAILAVMAAGLATAGSASFVSGERLAPTVLLMLALTAVLTGLIVFLLGALRWGRVARLLPYPVAGGFLAGSGYLVVTGAFKVLTREPLTWNGIGALWRTPALAAMVAFAVAAALLVLPRIWRHFLVVPSVIVAGFLLFYAGLWISGESIEAARVDGLLLNPLAEGEWTLPFTPLGGHAWRQLVAEWRDFLAMVVVVIVTILLNAAGLELATRRDVDLDRELRASGLGNIVAGLGGGMVGYISLSRSLLNVQAGAASRAAGVWTAVFCAAAAFVFTRGIAFVPRPVLAGLLLYLGLALFREWLWEAYWKLPLREYALIVVILVLMGAHGVITGVAFGLVVASMFFVVSYSRADYIRHNLSGSLHRSNKERSLEDMEALAELGNRARALSLQGYLFFALASSLVETCRDLIVHQRVRYLLLDFRMVQGLDASVALSFGKLHQLCVQENVTLALSGLRPDLERVLRQIRFLPHDEIHLVPDLDRGLEWIEERLLEGGDGTGARGRSDVRRLLAPHFGSDALDVLLSVCEAVELPKDAALIRRGETGDALYFVEHGELSVLVTLTDGTVKRVRKLGPGTVVGEMALYSGHPRSADVVAETDCRVYRLTAEGFTRLEREHPRAAMQFHSFVVKLLSQRLTASNDEIQALL